MILYVFVIISLSYNRRKSIQNYYITTTTITILLNLYLAEVYSLYILTQLKFSANLHLQTCLITYGMNKYFNKVLPHLNKCTKFKQ